jgi:hypothetical protein
LRRKSTDAESLIDGWVVDGMSQPGAAQECSAQAGSAARSGRVKFCVPGSPNATL